ncbi:PilZ domain-containing protein [Sphingomonas abietis]|uniref:PilZ domain-containing protein n=1 Tax=Sphingomonas abietis TaxID=3012344 RepID=A0ABY7NIX6_9SPHN|nr:PilZ domain-containing protein [Sphingomonas abietis]WBO21273.1 PilZ domain-containing protein [Sphingomonas abietis]
MATAVSSIESRRAPRDIVSFRTTIDGPATVRTSALMVDISPFGFMSRSAAPLSPGELVSVKLPMIGYRAAKIVWSLGGRVGGEFVDFIPADLYARMLKAAPTDKPAWNEF